MQSNKGEIKWLFNSIVKPTIKFLTILSVLRTSVVSILTTAVTSFLSTRRISTTTQVMRGECTVTAIERIKNLKGRTNECMVG